MSLAKITHPQPCAAVRAWVCDAAWRWSAPWRSGSRSARSIPSGSRAGRWCSSSCGAWRGCGSKIQPLEPLLELAAAPSGFDVELQVALVALPCLLALAIAALLGKLLRAVMRNELRGVLGP